MAIVIEALLRPGVRIMQRMNLPAKFLLISCAFLVPLGGLGMNAWEMTSVTLFPHLQTHDMMSSMPATDMGAASPGRAAWGFADWALIIAMWWVMMIATMTPGAAPAILICASVHRHALASVREMCFSNASGAIRPSTISQRPPRFSESRPRSPCPPARCQ